MGVYTPLENYCDVLWIKRKVGEQSSLNKIKS